MSDSTRAQFSPNFAHFTTLDGDTVTVRYRPAKDYAYTVECRRVNGTFTPTQVAQILDLLDAPKEVVRWCGPPF